MAGCAVGAYRQVADMRRAGLGLARIRICCRVAAADRFPLLRSLALRARRKRLDGLNAELVSAIGAAVRAGLNVAANGC